MSEIIKIEPGFSTADADCPNIEFKDGKLRVQFQDWKEKQITILFNDVCAFKWQEVEELEKNEPFDGICEKLGSTWLKSHLHQGAIHKSEGHHHYSFNFNACGKLEVICISFKVET